MTDGHPNLVFVFGDQWRAQAFGYAGDPNARTPHLDAFAGTNVNFTNALSGCPICSPYRASLMTGQYPLTHGVFINDVAPRLTGPTFAEALSSAGYDTAYIGKWHIDGRARAAFIPPERRMGFRYWRALECTHDYNHSVYHADTDTPLLWDGYDAEAQTQDAIRYLETRPDDRPFALFLSWGPPHSPYGTAPEEFRRLFDGEQLDLPPNVPTEREEEARKRLEGYYAHGAALDAYFGDLLQALDRLGLTEETIVVFTSDHGDMLCSQGSPSCKQQPWDESIRVPFLLRHLDAAASKGRELSHLIDAPDIMPTLLSLCGVTVPDSVEGQDFSPAILGEEQPTGDGAYLLNVFPFHDWVPTRDRRACEWRGLRTDRYTYAINHDGPWLLYDNEQDPCQMTNLVASAEHDVLREEFDATLQRMMQRRGDEFLPGLEYMRRWEYLLNEKGDIPIFQTIAEREAWCGANAERLGIPGRQG